MLTFSEKQLWHTLPSISSGDSVKICVLLISGQYLTTPSGDTTTIQTFDKDIPSLAPSDKQIKLSLCCTCVGGKAYSRQEFA